MKLLKKILCLVLAFTLLSSAGISVVANLIHDEAIIELKEELAEILYETDLSQRIGTQIEIIPISEFEGFPEGVIPHRVNTFDEIVDVLEAHQRSLSYINLELLELDVNYTNQNEGTFNALSASRTVHASNIDSLRLGISSTVWLRAWVTRNASGFITQLSPYTTQTGLGLGNRWVHNTAGHTLTNAGRSATVFASGTNEVYVIHPTLVVIARQAFQLRGNV